MAAPTRILNPAVRHLLLGALSHCKMVHPARARLSQSVNAHTPRRLRLSPDQDCKLELGGRA